MRQIVRSFSVNGRDDGEEGGHLQFHNQELMALDSEADLCVTQVTDDRNLPPGTILMNLDHPYSEKTNKLWPAKRYPSFGNALLTLWAITSKAGKGLEDLKSAPTTPSNELKRKQLGGRRQRSERLTWALRAQEDLLLKLFAENAPIEELRTHLGVRPYYSWLELLIRYKAAGEVEYAERVRQTVAARHLLDCLRQNTSGRRNEDFVQRGLAAPLRLILDVYKPQLGKWGSQHFSAALSILHSLVMSQPLADLANNELRLALESIDAGADLLLKRLDS